MTIKMGRVASLLWHFGWTREVRPPYGGPNAEEKLHILQDVIVSGPLLFEYLSGFRDPASLRL